MATFTSIKANNNHTQNSYFVYTVYVTRVIMFASLFAILFNLTGCNPNADVVNPENVNQLATASSPRTTAIIDSNSTLRSVANFPIGVATGSWLAKKEKGFKLFKDQFNAKTVHAYMNIETSPGKFNYQEIDYWSKWAETNPIRLHGHCLVFHTGAPEWITKFKGNRAEFEQMIKNHIQTIVGHQKGKIRSWDVFNEIYTDKGKIAQTTFRKLYDSDEAYLAFVKLCFQWAHESDPDALLFYNDYSFENSQAKLDAVIKMVEDFRSSGIPINGVGTQMHISVNTSESGIRNSFIKLASTGMLIHVSELDITINPNNDPSMVINKQLLEAQQSKYKSVAITYSQVVPRNLQYGITLWDFSDADSWIVAQKKKNDAPCIFDANYNKKPAFYGLIQGLMK